MNRVSVLHLITGLSVGGAEMMLYKVLGGMDRSRFCNRVVSLTDEGPMAARIRSLGVPVEAVGMRRGTVTLGGLSRLTARVRRQRPHILQGWMYHANLAGLVCGRVGGARHILWNIRSANEDLRGRPLMTVLTVKGGAWLSSQPEAVLINSEAGRKFHEELGYRPRRWLVIPNGFDVKQFVPDPAARRTVRDELGLGPDAVLVGLVGRYHPVKDQPGFLRAALAVQAQPRDVHFVLAGADVVPGNPALAPVLAGQPAAARVHLLGECKDVPRLMAALDILVSSSVGEGFPNVVGEAMACGVPCVVTDVGDSARIVGEAGMVVPPRDPAALAQAMQKLIDAGPDYRRRLGRAGRKRVEENFSLECVVRRYEELYWALANG
jgi:glycosyltransferase involved in cell wall biosynthesis